MKSDIVKKETFDEYTLNMIESRTDNGFEYDELYETILGEEYHVSPTESRKRTRGIRDYLLKKQSMSNDETNSEMARLSEKESIEIKPDNSRVLEKFILANEDELKSPKRIMEILGYDPNLWELTSSKISKWNVSGGVGSDTHKLLYAIKCAVKPKAQEFNIEWAKEVFCNLNELPAIKKYTKNKGKKIVELQYADLHIGLRGCEYEEQLKEMTDRIISSLVDVDIILLPVGQDLLNSNHVENSASVTVKGTGVESSMTYSEMFKSGLRVYCHIVDRIIEQTNAIIDMPYILGNHDEHSAFGVYQSLMQRYHLNENIIFDDEMTPRKYRSYGINGIGLGHGQSEAKRIIGLFSVEAPEIFARSTCREFHLSHLHSETVKSDSGITFRRLPTVNKADKWHTTMGFVGATNRIQVFEYDSEEGLKSISYFNIK